MKDKQFIEPYIDIYEKENNIHCIIDMPGVDKNNVELIFDKGNLTIKGKTNDIIDNEWNILSEEFKPVNYKRIISFPDVIDYPKSKAKMNNGVLHVTIPRKPEINKTIEVKVQ